MRTRIATFVVVCAGLLVGFSACAKTDTIGPSPIGPTGPTGPTGSTGTLTTLTVRSGEDNSPVSGAAVKSGTSSGTTDTSGQVSLNVNSGATVNIMAGGYLQPRMAMLPSDGVFFLIPDRPDLPFTDMAYGVNSYLTRWEGAGILDVAVYLSPELQTPQIIAGHQAGIALLNAAQSSVRLSLVTSQPTSGRFVTASLDPSIYPARASGSPSGGTAGITGGKVRYESLDIAAVATTVAHELTHILGVLGHNPGSGIMSAVYDPQVTAYTSAEKTVIKLLYIRHSGNTKPDADANAKTAALAGAFEFTVICK